ncbi:hypothetical protein [Kribbella sp. NPDC004875]|uniref:hypothetical protein n=1 Tax=Kribbella sp. NPDC004875 TaxID=3364107 RepID=UPI0036B53785
MEPTDAARWRRSMIRPVLERYAATDGVDVVMLSGSTARGDADRWSDVEVGVFWHRPPTEAERLAAAEGATDVRTVSAADAPPPWLDQLSLGAPRPDGLTVDVMHTQTTAVERLLDDVLVSCRPDEAAFDLLQGILDAGEASGPRAELLAHWQERAASYPRELATAVIRRNGNIEKFWRWQMLTERDNPLLLAREFLRVATQMLNVLHALNGRYCGHVLSFKRLDTIERTLLLAPPALASRLRAVFTQPPAEAAETLRTLVEETFDLVETHLPEIDVDRLRATFRSDRKPLDSAH